MLSRILIANRGEVALRIIRACKELSIETVVVYSEADRDAFYVGLADDAICIGPAQSSKSYLNIPAIISAAEIADVEAIHPGYGFLAENSHFADICESCNIKFIGPSPAAMELVGNKVKARQIAADHKVPVLPGGEFAIDDEDGARKLAVDMGFPVMIKATSGGGGRGMRAAHNEISLVASIRAARAEAEASFRDCSLYLEKLLQKPRHIEVQIIADEHGNMIHLGDRECSVQRRHQKLIEEAPAPNLPHNLREDLHKAAIRLAEAVNYTNAGTVEFLVDEKGSFCFIEMNARLQVEHPITEMITGLDIVKLQLRIASGEKLRIRQRKVNFRGTAIECRINAEDPDNDFKPSPGTITFYSPPGGMGVRIDSHAHAGYEITPYYDSLLGKLITFAPTRKNSINLMRRALDEFEIEGVKTTIPLYRRICNSRRFVEGKLDTGFVEDFLSKK